MLPLPVKRNVLRNDPSTWFNEDLDRFFNTISNETPFGRSDTGAYPVDIDEDEKSITVDAELPGFRSEDIDVNIDDNLLTIRAERTDGEREKGKRHYK